MCGSPRITSSPMSVVQATSTFQLSSVGCGRALDLDRDPVAIAAVLSADPLLVPGVRDHPGVRSPGAIDGFELAVSAVLGQQVSVAAARTFAGRIVARYGDLVSDFDGAGLTSGRLATLRSLRDAIVTGDVDVGYDADCERTHAALLAIKGIGPWTADYIVMRALSHPDVLPRGDIAIAKGAQRLGIDLAAAGDRWRPFRSYAAHYLWMAAA